MTICITMELKEITNALGAPYILFSAISALYIFFA